MRRYRLRDVAWGVCVAGMAWMALAVALKPARAQNIAGLQFTCAADDIGATLTRLTGCIAPEPGMRRYVTDIVAQSTTTTSGQFILRFGTGTNCGTGTTSLLPSAATAARIASPANTAAPTVISFRSPLVVPSGKDLCVLGVATNTTTIQVSGYVAP
jgi:hypothetical protein